MASSRSRVAFRVVALEYTNLTKGPNDDESRETLLEGLHSFQIGQLVAVCPRDDEGRALLRRGLDAGITQTCTQRDTGNSRRAGRDVRADLVALVGRDERRQACAERRS